MEILGMTFEHGEVLTSDKMNQLAQKVDVIISSITAEATRAKAREDELQTLIENAKRTFTSTIEAEKNRAVAVEDELKTSMGTVSADGSTLTIKKVEYALTKKSEQFYRGFYNGSINDLKGGTSIGLWTIVEGYSSIVFGSISYLFVTLDRSGATFQYHLLGETALSSVNAGVNIRTRQYYPSSGAWSEWKYIQGEAMDNIKTLITKNSESIERQQVILDGIKLNQDESLSPIN